ncbi:MAG: arsinothricin resistance N-acetyltransferase ArsN1 family B [Gemmatimonadota bacterium]
MSLIRPVERTDAAVIAAIYNYYVSNSIVTFEEEPVVPAEMARRIDAVVSASLPWLVLEDGGRVAGYAYATQWKSRPAYRFAVESTIYLAHDVMTRGFGTTLYEHLFDALRARSFHTVIGGVALPNDASVALHQKLGMTRVAHFREVGFKFGRWIDVAYWQRNL